MEEYKLELTPEGEIMTVTEDKPESVLSEIIEALAANELNVALVQRMIALEMAYLTREMENSYEGLNSRALGERVRALRELGKQVESLRK
jgi:hypothetical protein